MIAYKQVYKHSVQTVYKAGENKAIVKNSMQEKGTSSVIKKSWGEKRMGSLLK